MPGRYVNPFDNFNLSRVDQGIDFGVPPRKITRWQRIIRWIKRQFRRHDK